MTLSAIAAADGTVSKDTVQRAIDNSTFSNEKVESTKVIGKDGKSYPAKKPRQREHTYIHENDAKKKRGLSKTTQSNYLILQKYSMRLKVTRLTC